MHTHVIESIAGRAVRAKNESGELEEFMVIKRADVTLNGKKVTLAALSNGDHVTFSAGKKDGFHKVTAERHASDQYPNVPRLPGDLSQPRPLPLKKGVAPGDPLVPETTEDPAKSLRPGSSPREQDLGHTPPRKPEGEVEGEKTETDSEVVEDTEHLTDAEPDAADAEDPEDHSGEGDPEPKARNPRHPRHPRKR